MMPSVLLLLLISSTQAAHFYGTMMTYYPKDAIADGSVNVTVRYKLSFHSCTDVATWVCTGNCGSESIALQIVDQASSGDWCQREGVMTRLVPSNAPFQLVLASGNWISNINGIVSWKAVTYVELRNRSDTSKANTSPQTTIMPAVRVPSNCQRDLNLLAFDPDGDAVTCRYGSDALSECNPCTPPSVLSLSPSCTLSFSPTNSSNEGLYAVQLVVEDFPSQTINLTQTNGSLVVKTTNDAISKISIQFVLIVDPAVPSCTEGDFLPKLLSPTPANRAQLFTLVNQALEITIRAEAANSTISELLFSGPYNVIQNSTGSGQFTLKWTPSDQEDGESHPICFIIQANSSSGALYHSELRCVVVTVGNSSSVTRTPSVRIASLITTTEQPTTMTTTAALTTTTEQPTTMTTTAALTTTTEQPTTMTTTAALTTTTEQPTTMTTTAALTTTTEQPTTITTTAAPTTTTTHPTTMTTTASQTTTTTQLTTTSYTAALTGPTEQPTTMVTTPALSTTTTQPTTMTTTAALTTTTIQPTTTSTAALPTTTTQPTTTATTHALTTTTTQPTTMATTPAPTTTTAQPTTMTTTAAPTTTTAQPTTMVTTAAPTTTTTQPTTMTTTAAPTTTTTQPTTMTPSNTTLITTPASGPFFVIAVNIRMSTTLSLENNIDAILTQLKEELVRRGLPSNISLRLLRSKKLEITTTPGG
ncbi:mucin-5AC-like [Melanotaenia boesemani]|uniref:mucin-5AC-like n=1 Tax=Melanotaenia boesemani TaxID=1250792 RepID=UPI001C03BEDB|nr:mucin-5AC-like [Melanotaenia boesemani]